MEHAAAIEVSPERASICVLDSGGKIVVEAEAASEPEALSA